MGKASVHIQVIMTLRMWGECRKWLPRAEGVSYSVNIARYYPNISALLYEGGCARFTA